MVKTSSKVKAFARIGACATARVQALSRKIALCKMSVLTEFIPTVVESAENIHVKSQIIVTPSRKLVSVFIEKLVCGFEQNFGRNHAGAGEKKYPVEREINSSTSYSEQMLTASECRILSASCQISYR